MHVFFRYQFITSVSKTIGYTSQKTTRLLILPLLIVTMALLSACGGGGGSGQTTSTGGSTGGTANTGGSSNTGNTTSTVIANPDTISTDQDAAINIPVLVNDSGYSNSSIVSLEGTPSNGNATVLANNTVRYTPNASYTGTDSFSYQITNGSSIAVATVTVNVQCTTCAPDKIIALSWNPSVSGSDSGYIIFYGPERGDVMNRLYDLSPTTGLDPNAPYIEFSMNNDLNLNPGDNVCFKIKAYSSSEISSKSKAICGIV